jgi:hypothetical protein
VPQEKPGVPELDVARVRRWCRGRVPAEVLDQVRVECDVAGRDLTIVERRPPWRAEPEEEWTRTPVARLRYLTSRGVWTLYWSDSDAQWRRYQEVPPSPDVESLLTEIDRDPTALFWG